MEHTTHTLVRSMCCAAIVVLLAAAASAQTALPAGGGEPGAAYLECQAAIQQLDLDGLIACASSDRASDIRSTEAAEAKEMLEFIQMMQPTDIAVTGGTIDGDTATLEVTGTQDGDKATGTVTMVREDGSWKIQEESWTSGP